MQISSMKNIFSEKYKIYKYDTKSISTIKTADVLSAVFISYKQLFAIPTCRLSYFSSFSLGKTPSVKVSDFSTSAMEASAAFFAPTFENSPIFITSTFPHAAL